MMNLPAGLKWIGIAAIVLAVISTSYFTIRYIQKNTESSITIKLQDETIGKRDNLKDAIDKSVGNNSPADDSADSLQWLRDRQSDKR